jgi:L-threonylcarbamoyladenylate synthase
MSMQLTVPLNVKKAAQIMSGGGVIAYPTEAIWGLGCDPNNKKATERLIALKGRSPDKGLILIAASTQQLAPYLDGLEPKLRAKLDANRPAPTTWLVPDNGVAPSWIKGQFPTVAVRVSTHPIVVQLCLEFGGPIVSTSANYSGEQPPRWPWQVRKQLGHGLNFILHGQLGGANRPSEIMDLITDKVLRQG